jgi:2,3-bisphosphoglycerate-dependent phosphoglycerate mutase
MYLIRHCETSGQDPDAALTERGLTQAQSLAQRLAREGIVRLVSSPYRRARQSAEPLATRLGLELEVEPRLRERQLGENFGARFGANWLDALRATFLEPDLTFDGGESSRVAQLRARAVFDQVATEARLPAALVTHGNLLSLLAGSIQPELGFEFWQQLTNPDLFLVELNSEAPTLKRLALE